MSPQEVLQVKARFNGRFSDSLSESSLFKGITEVLTDCKSSDKEHRKKGHVLLGLVSDPHGFNLCALSFCGCICPGCLVKTLVPNRKAIRECQKVCFPQFLKADTLEIRGFHPTVTTHGLLSASGRRKPMLLLIRVTTHLCVLPQRTERWSSCRFIRLSWNGPTAVIPAEASHT